MPDLIFFLEQHAFHPRTEEIEAILRRCDHDSDGALSYEEFCCMLEDLPLDNAEPVRGGNAEDKAEAANR